MEIGIGIGIVLTFLVVVVSWPSKPRTVDMGPSKAARAAVPIIQSEYDILTERGVINGTPGRLSDAAVRAGIHQALNGSYTQEEKYELLDQLQFAVYNNHADGMSARVLDEISKALDQVQGLR